MGDCDVRREKMVKHYQVNLDVFEGPLDLLLHLINRYEIDIYDLPVAQVTKQYMEFIHTMQELELNIASEYLVMAATLLQIKSTMLLPHPELDDDYTYEEEEEDPREALIERLIEYRKYKEVASDLKERADDSKESYTRPPEKVSVEAAVVPMNETGSIYDMLAAMQKVFERKKWQQPMTRTIEKVDIPIKKRMEQVLDVLNEYPDGIIFDELFPYPSKSHMVITFIAMLELMKERQIYCEQQSTFDALKIYKWRS